MKRFRTRDYAGLKTFAKRFKGHPTADCIDEYAKCNRIVSTRVEKAFRSLIDGGMIRTHTNEYGTEIID